MIASSQSLKIRLHLFLSFQDPALSCFGLFSALFHSCYKLFVAVYDVLVKSVYDRLKILELGSDSASDQIAEVGEQPHFD